MKAAGTTRRSRKGYGGIDEAEYEEGKKRLKEEVLVTLEEATFELWGFWCLLFRV